MPLAPRIPRDPVRRSAVKADEKKTRTAASHVALVKLLPCCATGKVGPNDPHHLMKNVERGMGFKAAGRYVIPLCRAVHTEITPHGNPEAVLMERYGIDARALADALWGASPDLAKMQQLVFKERQQAFLRLNTPGHL